MKINDLVMVTDCGRCYGGYYKFFEKHNLPVDMASRFAYCDNLKFFGLYRIIFAINDGDNLKYIIEEINSSKKLFIVDEKGILKIGEVDKNYDEITQKFYDIMAIRYDE